MKKLRWTSRLRKLPTATFGGYADKGKHSKPILSWLIKARKIRPQN